MGMGKGEFPTTDDYKIGVDINLPLAKAFWRASKGLSLEDFLPVAVRGITGRSDVAVEVVPGMEEGYLLDSKAMCLNSQNDVRERIGSFMRASFDNLPHNIPKELTPELMSFVVALHESEHARQFQYKKSENGDDRLTSVTYGSINEDQIYKNSVVEAVMSEVDADLPVVRFLKEEGMENVAQFYLDMRMIAGFTTKFPFCGAGSYAHDLSMILDQYEKTGKLMDPDEYLSDKMILIERLYEDLGIGKELFSGLILRKYIKSDYLISETIDLEKFIDALPEISPQKIRCALENMLERGDLGGIEKLEAENFIAAAERMGYKADPDPNYIQNYKDQINAVVNEYFGSSAPKADVVQNAAETVNFKL